MNTDRPLDASSQDRSSEKADAVSLRISYSDWILV